MTLAKPYLFVVVTLADVVKAEDDRRHVVGCRRRRVLRRRIAVGVRRQRFRFVATAGDHQLNGGVVVRMLIGGDEGGVVSAAVGTAAAAADLAVLRRVLRQSVVRRRLEGEQTVRVEVADALVDLDGVGAFSSVACIQLEHTINIRSRLAPCEMCFKNHNFM